MNEKKGKRINSSRVVLNGIMVSTIVTAIGVAVFSVLTWMEKMPAEFIPHGSALIIAMASTAGALYIMRKYKQKRILAAAIIASSYFCLLLACNPIMFRDGYNGVFITAITVFCGCATAALISIRMPKKKKNHKSR